MGNGPRRRRRAGGATRIVLGNPHADHRGGAPAVGAPVHCHVDDRENVEGDGAAHDFDFGLRRRRSRAPGRRRSPPGRPLPVAATLVEGDRVGDFEGSSTCPAHSPGTIALWR